jgi:hypothetical protein
MAAPSPVCARSIFTPAVLPRPKRSAAMRWRPASVRGRDPRLAQPLMLLGDMRAQRGELAAADSVYSTALSILGAFGRTAAYGICIRARGARPPSDEAGLRRKAGEASAPARLLGDGRPGDGRRLEARRGDQRSRLDPNRTTSCSVDRVVSRGRLRRGRPRNRARRRRRNGSLLRPQIHVLLRRRADIRLTQVDCGLRRYWPGSKRRLVGLAQSNRTARRPERRG